MQGYYYIVHKTPTGWRTYLSIAFVTLAEAQSAFVRVGSHRTDLRISCKTPASIGYGWTALDTKDLVKAGDLA